MRILVVDDEEGGRYLAASILNSAGHEVEVAVDGFDALEKARANRPDVVLSDVLMPRMDGYQLVREWKRDPELAHVPIVFYTASYTDAADEKFALDLGVDGFLSKPVEPAVLLSVIEEVVRNGGTVSPRRPESVDETEVLREYSERLVRKLEEKVSDLERSNTMVGQAMTALGEEVEIKRGLIDDLSREIDERKHSEQERRAERDFSQRIIDVAHMFIVGLDRDHRIVLFSPGAERISGWAAQEVLGELYYELFVPEEVREMRRAATVTLLESGETLRHVGNIRTSDGDMRLLDWSETVTTDVNGDIDGVIAFGTDVTDRMTSAAVERAMARIDLAVLLDRPRAEVLEVTCERLVAEFGHPLAFIVLRDQDHGSIEVEAMAGTLAASFDEITGSISPGRICPVERAMERDEVTVVTGAEVTLEGLDPARLNVAAAAAIPLRAHGVTIGAIGLVAAYPRAFDGARAETLRRLADRVAIGILVSEGRQQAALQSAALESAGNGIVIADVEGRVTWVNRAFTALTGFSLDEAVGSDLLALEGDGRGSYREPLYREAWEAVRSGKTWREEFVNVRHDGVGYLEDASFAPVADEQGAIGHVVIVKQDLSERREFEQLKGNFTAVVSHELRTPLTSIIGFADLLAKVGVASLAPPADTALEKLRENARKMQDLVERLLEVSQMETEGLKLDLGRCSVETLVEDAIEGVTTSHDVTIRFERAAEPIEVMCDRIRIARALGNILDNAVKHSPEGGSVTVTVTPGETMVAVSVTDEGEGMPSEKIPALFERFTQLDMSSTRRFGGMGIGLFVAYGIARAHGGMIVASSEQGVGSTFTFLLPPEGPGADQDTRAEGL